MPAEPGSRRREMSAKLDVYTNEAEAAKAAEGSPRTRGFRAEHGKRAFFVTARSLARAQAVAFVHVGGKVERVGKAARKPNGRLLARAKTMSAEDRAALIAQLQAIDD